MSQQGRGPLPEGHNVLPWNRPWIGRGAQMLAVDLDNMKAFIGMGDEEGPETREIDVSVFLSITNI